MLNFMVLSLQTSPYSFSLFALWKESLNAIYKRQWPQLPGYLMPTKARGRKQDPYNFVAHHLPLTASPCLI